MVVAGGGCWRVVASGGGWWSHLLGAEIWRMTWHKCAKINSYLLSKMKSWTSTKICLNHKIISLMVQQSWVVEIWFFGGKYIFFFNFTFLKSNSRNFWISIFYEKVIPEISGFEQYWNPEILILVLWDLAKMRQILGEFLDFGFL